MQLHLALLGGVHAQLASGQPAAIPGPRVQALLAYLALPTGQAHPRDKLAVLLWPEAPHDRARQSLRQALMTLRQALPPKTLVEQGETVMLDPGLVETDVAAFERSVSKGSVGTLERGVALYRGDLLAGLGVQAAPFEEWLLTERERLRELAIETLTTVLAQQIQAGETQPAIQIAVRLLGLDPAQESAHRALMRLYARDDRRGAALRQYQTCVAALERELGVAPDPETKTLYQQLLQAPSSGSVSRASADRPVHRPGVARFGIDAFISGIPLVGRETERARLRQTREAAWNGHGATALIQGDAGIGKSRLVEAFVAEAMEAGGQVLLGRAYETQQILPFAPWVEAFRAGDVISDVLGRDDFDPGVRGDLARLFPELGAPSRKVGPVDYVRLFDAMARVVQALTERQPLVLVLEDLHWADEMSLRLLAFLTRRLSTWPIVILATTRAEELIANTLLHRCVKELSGDPRFTSTTLLPLSPSETGALVRTLGWAGLGEPAVRRLTEQMWQASEGNPFMVIETMRELHDREGDDALPLSARVRELISGRLARLSDRGRQLAQAASVIGREFDFALLARVNGIGPHRTAEVVEELVARRILHVVGERLDFTHDRIREVAYDELLAPRRKLLHADVGHALEELSGPGVVPDPLALGLHYRSGEVWDRALTYLAEAGRSAAARSAHRDAVTSFELALDSGRHLPATREWLQQAIDLRFDLRNSLLLLGEPDRLCVYLHEAEALARTLADRPRAGRTAAYLSHYFWRSGRSPEALVQAGQALAIAEALDDRPLLVAANLCLGLASHTAGNYAEAETFLCRVIDLLPDDFARERLGQHAYPAVNARTHLVCALAERGDFERAFREGADGLRLAEDLDQPLSIIYACWGLAVVHGIRGDAGDAAALLERALAVADRWDITDWRPIATAFLGDAYARRGRVSEGLDLLGKGLEAMESAGLRVFQSLILAYSADACLQAGRVDEAARLARQALDLARNRGERGFEATALRVFGDVAARTDPVDAHAADDFYRQSLELSERLGMQPLVAQCRARLADLRDPR